MRVRGHSPGTLSFSRSLDSATNSTSTDSSSGVHLFHPLVFVGTAPTSVNSSPSRRLLLLLVANFSSLLGVLPVGVPRGLFSRAQEEELLLLPLSVSEQYLVSRSELDTILKQTSST